MFPSGIMRCRPRLASSAAPAATFWLSFRQPSRPLTARNSVNSSSSGSNSVSSFSTAPPEAEVSTETEISKRKQFKQIAIDPKVMRHLDMLGMGMEKKKIERGRKLRLYRRFASRHYHLPWHFVVKIRCLLLLAMAQFPTNRGAVSSAMPGETVAAVKPKTFDHPTWAVKQLSSVTTLKEIPPAAAHLPEVALVGRSNVGKSTLLNALVGLKRHPDRRASVSKTPGETRTLDFFQLGKGKRAKMVLADMPGYGFAYAQEEQREDWKGLMMAYLKGRGAPLKRVMLLLDARHGFKKADIEFLERLYDPKGPSPLGKYRPPKIQILLTKCDLVKRIDLARRVALVRQQLEEVSRRQTNLSTMTISALKGAGVVELQRELAALDPKPTAAVDPDPAESDGALAVNSAKTPEAPTTDKAPGHHAAVLGRGSRF
ncbi:unnamed protein product [Pylaiella littoralis]